jgi:hypothetical protein
MDQGGAAVSAIGGGNPQFYIDGPLATAIELAGFIAPSDGTLSNVFIYCRAPGSAGSTIVDVNIKRAGGAATTIFTTQANRPALAWNDVNQVAKSGDPDVTAVIEEDVITIDIDQVATGASDLTVIVVFEPDVTPPHAHSGGPHTGALALTELEDHVTGGLPLLSGGVGGDPAYEQVDWEGIADHSIDDDKAGERVLTLSRRRGGTGNVWTNPGTLSRPVTYPTMQVGCYERTIIGPGTVGPSVFFVDTFDYAPLVFCNVTSDNSSADIIWRITTGDVLVDRFTITLEVTNAQTATISLYWMAVGELAP